MGAWIETLYAQNVLLTRGVAPRVGAWIETLRISFTSFPLLSHLVWVRGLKLNKASDYTEVDGRTSCGCVD